MTEKIIIIFHCEFSQKRGPRLWAALRELDRKMNLERYPQLFFPEMYILEGGYKRFYAEHPDLCEGGYKPEVEETGMYSIKQH